MSLPARRTPAPKGVDAIASAAGGIGRLLASAAVYPRGHPRCVEIAEQARAACQECGAQGVVLAVNRQTLAAGAVELSQVDLNVARLHGTLHTLAIASLRIDPSVTVTDLEVLAAALLAQKVRVQRSTTFTSVDLGSQLPATIQVAHRAFGSRVVSESIALTLQGARAAMLQLLDGLAPEDELAAAAELAGCIVARIVERVELGKLGPAESAAQARALDAVLDLCAHAMRHAVEQMLDAGEPLSEIGKLAHYVEEAVAVADDERSVEVLLEVLHLVGDETAHRPGSDAAGDPHVLAVAQIEQELAALAVEPRPFIAPDVEQQEHLAILLQLALRAEASELPPLAAALRTCAAASRTSAGLALLVRGCAAFAAERELPLVDRFLPTLFEPARDLPDGGLRDFLRPLCAAMPARAALARIWPHVVNELLHDLGRPASSEQTAADCDLLWQRLSSLTGLDREGCIKRLLRLDFVEHGRLPERVLDEAATNAREVLATVVGWPEGDALGRHLFEELRQGPPRWSGWQALFAMPQYDASARRLVQQALRAGSRTAESRELAQLSAQVLAAELPELPKARRTEPWIPDALLVLGALPGVNADPVLHGVLRRRLGVPQWSAACRRAARQALSRCHAGGRGNR